MTSQIVERRDANEHHLLPDEVIDLHIGKRIRRRRRLMGITLEMLAGATGVRFQQIQKYECAGNRVLASRLYALAAALNVPVQYFFDGLPPQGAVANDRDIGVEDSDLNAEMREIVAIMAKLPPRVRRKLSEFAKSLCDEVGG